MKQKRKLFSFEQCQDLRSLAAFRILTGIYIMYDIASRLQHGRILSLSWYTSSENSFLHPDDTPHRSPIHRIWFYRGSESVQFMLFALTFLLALSFALGYKCCTISKTLFWINVVAMQCRCMPPHDGSDTFIRHLILWCISLPVSQVWSMDARSSKNNKHEKQKLKSHHAVDDHCSIKCENRAAVWGIRLQIVFMYLGTILHRTVDQYGLYGIFKSKWLPPQLTAVHYALSGSFSTRECWLGNYVRSTLPLSQAMTCMAMLQETFAPIMCLLLNSDYVHIPAFLLFHLHFGLLVLMNLPNWQLVGMISSIIWIPSHSWDGLQHGLAMRFPQWFSVPKAPLSPMSLKKKDIFDADIDMSVNVYENDKNNSNEVKAGNRKHHRRPYLTYFFFSYMILDFAGNRKWIPKIDNGDIGEFLRFSQWFVMYSGPPTTANHIMLTAALHDGNAEGDENVNINVWEWMKNGHIERIDLDSFENDAPWTNWTHVFPSPRLERTFTQDWTSGKRGRRRTDHFLQSLCRVAPFSKLRFTSQELKILAPWDEERYSRIGRPFVVERECP